MRVWQGGNLIIRRCKEGVFVNDYLVIGRICRELPGHIWII